VELGKAIGMSKGGASKLVSRLVKKGLVDKRKTESDRRFRSVGLTRQGRQFVVRLAPHEKAMDRRFFGPLGNTGRFRLTG
jgi:DNA-binding MarR family transcriptional regulator